ncbi:MAG: hypothetical protein WDN31_21400 [Hyphomicrobium sp.]
MPRTAVAPKGTRRDTICQCASSTRAPRARMMAERSSAAMRGALAAKASTTGSVSGDSDRKPSKAAAVTRISDVTPTCPRAPE